MNAPDPRPDLPGEVRGKRRGARRAKTRSVRRHSGLFAIGGVVVAGVLVAVVAQSVSGSSIAVVGDAGQEVVSEHPVVTPEPDSQKIVPATPLVRKASPKNLPGGAMNGSQSTTLATRAEKLAAKFARQAAVKAAAAVPVRIASFNVLGASHTKGKHGRPGFADGVTRARQAADLIASLELDVYGAQEFEPSQQAAVAARLPGYSMYPGQSGSFIEGTNSIVWRTERFDVLQTKTVGIPYFGGHPVQMPYVLLKEKASGRKIWFANFHNPADVHGAAGHWRAKAIAIEADLATALGADGTPVIMTGDFNDRSEFFCPFTSQAPFMTSASGATGGPPCNVPRGASVDWLLGSSTVSFAQYQAIDGGVVDRITDHPVIVADATFGKR